MLPNPKKPKVPAWMGKMQAQGQAMGADGNQRLRGEFVRRYQDPNAQMQPNIQGGQGGVQKEFAAIPRRPQTAMYPQYWAEYNATPRTYTTGADERKNFMVNGNLVRMAPNSQMTIPGRQQPPVPKWQQMWDALMGREQQGKPSWLTGVKG